MKSTPSKRCTAVESVRPVIHTSLRRPFESVGDSFFRYHNHNHNSKTHPQTHTHTHTHTHTFTHAASVGSVQLSVAECVCACVLIIQNEFSNVLCAYAVDLSMCVRVCVSAQH